jgi:hypothetical protein
VRLIVRVEARESARRLRSSKDAQFDLDSVNTKAESEAQYLVASQKLEPLLSRVLTVNVKSFLSLREC